MVKYPLAFLKKMSALACIFLLGCQAGRGDREFFQNYRAQVKPVVSIMPLIDRSQNDLPWSLSEEITEQLRAEIEGKGSLILTSSEKIGKLANRLTQNDHPFHSMEEEYTWMKDAFIGEEFVVFTELVEHDMRAKLPKNRLFDQFLPSCELVISMRIRIFDLRVKEPQIILQELIHRRYPMSKPAHSEKRDPNRWKKMVAPISPLGTAHAKICKEVSQRIEDYVLFSHDYS